MRMEQRTDMQDRMTRRLNETARVLYSSMECAGYFRLGMACESPAWQRSRPGQFLMMQTGDGRDPLLRRPFSIHRLLREGSGKFTGVEILFKILGDGTLALSGLGKGARLYILGPLGRGFAVPPGLRRVFLAGGGIGAAPLPFLTERLLASGVTSDGITAFIGGRGRNDLLCLADLNRTGAGRVVPVTEDGSAGEMARVTGPLARALTREPPDMIYACGPMPMLRAVAAAAAAANIPCQVSIETRMACGIGACLGCAVPASEKGTYRHACTHGPVFDSRDLSWENAG